MTLALPLPALVPVEALTSPAQRFRCAPYGTSMAARGCLARQARLASGDATADERMTMSKCRGCALGAEVAHHLAGVADDGAPVAIAPAPAPRPRRVPAASVEAPVPASPEPPTPREENAVSEKCTHQDGCTRPQAQVTKRTREDWKTLCSKHRILERDRARHRVGSEPASTKRAPAAKAAKETRAKPSPVRASNKARPAAPKKPVAKAPALAILPSASHALFAVELDGEAVSLETLVAFYGAARVVFGGGR